jgi:hypothetical protein
VIPSRLDRPNNGFLGQKLIFRPSKNAQDLSFYPTTFENKCDIRDQHVLFYHSIKKTNGYKTKKFCEYLRGTPGTKK